MLKIYDESAKIFPQTLLTNAVVYDIMTMKEVRDGKDKLSPCKDCGARYFTAGNGPMRFCPKCYKGQHQKELEAREDDRSLAGWARVIRGDGVEPQVIERPAVVITLEQRAMVDDIVARILAKKGG